MIVTAIRKLIPSWQSLVLALLAAVLLALAFPDFEFWFLAWFALVPLMWAVELEKESVPRAFVTGWLFGTAFFFGTCWWLTYAPIHYAGFPWPLAYFLILIACIGAGVFPAIFTAILAFLLRRLGSWAFLAAPFVWVFTEFLRYWLTGNNWNALAYSQALAINGEPSWSALVSMVAVDFACFGGVALVSFIGLIPNTVIVGLLVVRNTRAGALSVTVILLAAIVFALSAVNNLGNSAGDSMLDPTRVKANVIAIQPNVPMSGVDQRKLEDLRKRQFNLAEIEINKVREQLSADSSQLTAVPQPITVILPESPMNFMYNDDPEFQRYVRDFTTKDNVSLIFNSAEPDPTNKKYFNSAMMIGPDGKPVAQYDKIYLLPFGEAVPVPLESIVPAFVGNFSYGREYDLLPLGDAKGGIMICFESHFSQLSREYVRNGADVLIEMTNDGYLGPTPVLRQHLANAVFRAVETNRPVLRVTNVGVTAYITEKGAVLDPAPVYQEDTRVWTVSKSDGSQTFYVRYGDWFAWLCSVVTLMLVIFSARRSNAKARALARAIQSTHS